MSLVTCHVFYDQNFENILELIYKFLYGDINFLQMFKDTVKCTTVVSFFVKVSSVFMPIFTHIFLLERKIFMLSQ